MPSCPKLNKHNKIYSEFCYMVQYNEKFSPRVRWRFSNVYTLRRNVIIRAGPYFSYLSLHSFSSVCLD